MTCTLRVFLSCLCPLLVGPAAAGAQDGVFIDPDSPSGREYAIPFEDARRQADPSGATGRVRQGERSSALFGEGITPREKTAGGRGNGSKGSPGGSRRGTRAIPPRRSGASRPVSPVVQAAAARPGAPSGGVSTALLIAGGTLLVLVGGGAAGVALRRRATE